MRIGWELPELGNAEMNVFKKSLRAEQAIRNPWGKAAGYGNAEKLFGL
jgi:hypothetical protein